MNNFYSSTLGQVLKEWLDDNNLTMYAVSKMLQVHRQPLDDLQSGKSSAPENALRYLVWVYGRDPKIWDNFITAISQANTEEEQQRIIEFRNQEKRIKEQAEAIRKAKEIDAVKATIRSEIQNEVSEKIKGLEDALAAARANENKIQVLEKKINDSVLANQNLQWTNQKLQTEIQHLQRQAADAASKSKKRSFWRRLFRLG